MAGKPTRRRTQREIRETNVFIRRRRTAALIFALLCGLIAGCGTPPPPKPTLLIYGDSLTILSEPAVSFLYGQEYKLVFRAAGGTAMCDWSSRAAADRLIYKPSRVVLAFTGNSHSCVTNDFASGGLAGLLANYSAALTQFHTAFNGLPISVLASPAMHSLWPANWFPENGNPALNQLYQSLCAKYQMSYNSDADNSLTPSHIFVWQRPRFVNGPMTMVRSADGVHLTPAGELWYAAALGAEPGH